MLMAHDFVDPAREGVVVFAAQQLRRNLRVDEILYACIRRSEREGLPLAVLEDRPLAELPVSTGDADAIGGVKVPGVC